MPAAGLRREAQILRSFLGVLRKIGDHENADMAGGTSGSGADKKKTAERAGAPAHGWEQREGERDRSREREFGFVGISGVNSAEGAGAPAPSHIDRQTPTSSYVDGMPSASESGADHVLRADHCVRENVSA